MSFDSVPGCIRGQLISVTCRLQRSLGRILCDRPSIAIDDSAMLVCALVILAAVTPFRGEPLADISIGQILQWVLQRNTLLTLRLASA